MYKIYTSFFVILLLVFNFLYADLGQMGVEAGRSERCVAIGDPKTKDVRNFGRTKFTQMKSLATGEELMFNCGYSKCIKAFPGSRNLNKDSTIPDKKLCCNKIIRLQQNGKMKWKCAGKTVSTDKVVKEMKFVDQDSEKMVSDEAPDENLKKQMEEEEKEIPAMPTPEKTGDVNDLLDDLKSMMIPELSPKTKK